MLWTLCEVILDELMSRKIKTYSELAKLDSFVDRFNYLKLSAAVGKSTFGFDRYMNQFFYHSDRWKEVRDIVIARDKACDLGVEGFDLHGKIIVHHMNPLLLNDIVTDSEFLLNPEYLIATCHRTHNAIHYGDENLLTIGPALRSANDTCPWKKSYE